MLDIFGLPTSSQQKRIVPPRGDPNAPIVLVGEAPGEQEERFLRPFVGRSGTLLKDCALKAGIPEYKLYMTNVIKERPKNNNITPFFSQGKFTDLALPYLQELKAELEKTSASVIVPVGNVAAAAICGLSSITKHRGSILESTMLPGRKTIPTIHPAAALRMYIQRYFIIHDLRKALVQSEFPDIRLPRRNLIITPTITDFRMWLIEFYDKVKRGDCQRRIAFDIEITGALELSCFSLSYNPNEAICIPVDRYSTQDEIEAMLLVAAIIEDLEMEVIGQNINFDLYFCIKKYHIHPKCRIQDTMIGHNVIYPDFPKGLDFLCSIYTDEPYYKDEGKEWRSIKDWPKFWRYSCKDSATTLEIWNNAIEPQLHSQGFWHTYLLDVEKHYPMFFPMLRGINADPPAIKRVKADLEKTIFRLQEDLDSEVEGTIVDRELKQVDKETGQFGYLNEASPKQVMKYFYMDLGITPYMSDGKPTCDDKALQRLAKGTATRKPIRAASLIQELRKHRKFRNTYLNMTFDEDSRFRCTYNPRGTIFGRLSSSQTIFHTGMNQQNLPAEFKHFLLADPGYIYVELDGVQAEWVATAYIANEAKMMAVVESGKDPHAATAEMLTGLPIPFVKFEDEHIGHTSDPDLIEKIRLDLCEKSPKYKEQLTKVTFLPRVFSFRQCAKKANHGFNYGLGPGKFALMNEVPDNEARTLHKYYHLAYPGLTNWYQRTEYELKRNRTLVNPFGRKIRLMERYGPDLFNQAYAFRPQSTVADQVRNAIDITYRKDIGGDQIVHPSELLTQTHDSVGYQYPISQGAEAFARFVSLVKEALELPITYEGRTFRILAEAKFGFNLGAYDKAKNVNPQGMRKLDISSIDSIIKDTKKLLGGDDNS
jgi:DNA polymerase